MTFSSYIKPRYTFNGVLWCVIYSAYSCDLFNQSSAQRHKGPMIWGAPVSANIGMNTQLISVFTSAHTLHNLVEGCHVWLTQHKLAEKETFTPHTHNKEPWFLLVHFIPYMLITRLCFIVSRDYSWDKLQLFPNCYYDDWIFVLCQALFTHYTPKFDPSMMHYWFHAGNHTANVKN